MIKEIGEITVKELEERSVFIDNYAVSPIRRLFCTDTLNFLWVETYDRQVHVRKINDKVVIYNEIFDQLDNKV